MTRALVAFLILLSTAVPANAQTAPAAWTATVDPDVASAATHLTITLSAAYCGGFRVGDGVYVQAEAPLVLSGPVPDGSALFAGGAATTDSVGDALRFTPAPGRVWSQICIQGQRDLSVELTPDAGFTLPDQPGTYALDVWTGENAQPVTVTFDVPAS
jgi:hypothetical protein